MRAWETIFGGQVSRMKEKIYKLKRANINRMFPSDPSGSLDDFYLNLRRGYGKNSGIY
jgi:hypothetical protein